MANNTRLYFEEIVLGHTWSSEQRVVTEDDIVGFANLSGDHNPLHMSQEFAEKSIFGKRIAHGLLGLSIASGLPSDESDWEIMAFMGLDWKFTKPIFIGDKIHYVSEVKQKKELKPDRGIVKMERKLVNQNEEVVQTGTWSLLVQRKSN